MMRKIDQTIQALFFSRCTLAIFVLSVLLVSCNLSRTPEVSTSSINAPMYSYLLIGGDVMSDGGTDILARGICWGEQDNPTILDSNTRAGIGTGSFTCTINGLKESTTYYFRAYATNEYGTSYGNQVVYTTANLFVLGEGLTDVEGNFYHTIILGDQEWMVENLKTTRYRNGDTISNITGDNPWCFYTDGAWCDYNNDPSISNVYGKLYNWFAVIDERNIAPHGWHIPTNDEWLKLVEYLGGETIAGGKMKEDGSAHWITPNVGAISSSGFMGLPGGNRMANSGFFYLQQNAVWWSSTEQQSDFAYNLSIFSSSADAFILSSPSNFGNSIRCVRD